MKRVTLCSTWCPLSTSILPPTHIYLHEVHDERIDDSGNQPRDSETDYWKHPSEISANSIYFHVACKYVYTNDTYVITIITNNVCILLFFINYHYSHIIGIINQILLYCANLRIQLTMWVIYIHVSMHTQILSPCAVSSWNFSDRTLTPSHLWLASSLSFDH